MLVNRATRIMCVLAFAMLAQTSFAQHADFVLFGESNPRAKETPKEHRFVHPVTSPYFHEDSFVTSDVRVWQVYHKIPNTSVLGGGNVDVTAAH